MAKVTPRSNQPTRKGSDGPGDVSKRVPMPGPNAPATKTHSGPGKPPLDNPGSGHTSYGETPGIAWGGDGRSC